MILVSDTLALFGVMFFSGLLPAILSVIFVIAVILATASETFTVAYVAFVIYLIAFAIFGSANPFTFVWHNPGQAFGFFIGYFVLGAMYSIAKYWSYVTKVVNIVKDIKKNFIIDNNLTISVLDEIPEDYQSKWKTYRYNRLNHTDRDRVDNLRATQQKALIMNWIAFWPFSAVGLFVAEPLKHLVTSIYEHLVEVYGKMFERIVSSKININDLK